METRIKIVTVIQIVCYKCKSHFNIVTTDKDGFTVLRCPECGYMVGLKAIKDISDC
jgi:DNA-directed RNA polymerase subunit RPC12/RpoP